MDAHERATSIWYRVAGLLRRKELAIEMIEAEIRSAQHQVWLEASKLVLSAEPIEIARQTARASGADDPAEVLNDHAPLCGLAGVSRVR
jgi:hypothetical protein